jgi:hypothetical protein
MSIADLPVPHPFLDTRHLLRGQLELRTIRHAVPMTPPLRAWPERAARAFAAGDPQETHQPTVLLRGGTSRPGHRRAGRRPLGGRSSAPRVDHGVAIRQRRAFCGCCQRNGGWERNRTDVTRVAVAGMTTLPPSRREARILLDQSSARNRAQSPSSPARSVGQAARRYMTIDINVMIAAP